MHAARVSRLGALALGFGAMVAVVLWLALGPPSSTPAQAATTTVYSGASGSHFSNTSMTNNCGNPCITNINPGDTVHWVWQGNNHTTTSDAASAQSWDSGEHDSGFIYDVTFPNAGTFPYRCSVHGSSMRGSIQVGPTATPTFTPPAPPTPAPPTNTPVATPMPSSTAMATPTPTSMVAATATPTRTLTATPTRSATPVATTPGGVAGDVNCSGAADSIDAALVLQFDAALVHSLSCQQNGDVSGDGNINSLDAALILQYTAGLIDHLPVGMPSG